MKNTWQVRLVHIIIYYMKEIRERLFATPHSDEMNDKDAPFSLETEADISKIDYFKQLKKKQEEEKQNSENIQAQKLH